MSDATLEKSSTGTVNYPSVDVCSLSVEAVYIYYELSSKLAEL